MLNIFLKEHFSQELAHDWPSRPLYAFPLVTMLPQVIEWIRESKCAVLLIAPLWKTQLWFSEMAQLLETAPWPLPLRRALLAKIWHPHFDLWALHVWPLNGYPGASRIGC